MSQRTTIIKQKQQPVLTVFLDVDGVLNTRTTCQRTPDGYTGVDDARVELMDVLKEFTGIELDYMEFKKYCLRRIGF